MSGGNLQRLSQCLVELRLPTFREHHSSQAALASKESWSYPQYLLALSELEVADRRERRIQRLRRTSKLPWDKSLTALGAHLAESPSVVLHLCAAGATAASSQDRADPWKRNSKSSIDLRR